ncbi:MAG: M48 family metallopeptidase [Candidatus Lokiarchaeota archaeon]|nr:M48 family metallopeptidase [Candidatus Lokiarchaeota archaeon]
MTGRQDAREFHDGEFHLEYTLTRTGRRTVGITVRPDASVVVRVPRHVTQRQVDDVIAAKKAWIGRKREAIIARDRSRPRPPAFSHGEALPYLGQSLRLVFRTDHVGKPRVEAAGGCLTVHVQRPQGQGPALHDLVREAVVGWYVDQAHAVLPRRVAELEAKVGVQPARVSIKDQRTRWGSCSSRGNVNLNWRLILCPPPVRDYVVIHELCHLKIHSHSASFWNLVASLVPGYKEHKLWLDSSTLLRDF